MENLTPFDLFSEDLSVQAEIQRSGDLLHVRYLALGRGTQTLQLPNVVPPRPVESGAESGAESGQPGPGRPKRKDELWKTTCFELFFSIQGQTDYFELGFSPSGEWNAYHFDSYRNGMETEMRIQATQIRHGLKDGLFELQASIDLSQLMAELRAQLGSPNITLDASLSAVIQNQKGSTSFWALRHVGNQPNFHLRDSFILKIR
jgi:hypothetical protein